MSYPNIKDPKFYNKINRKYNKYIIPNKKRTMKQICFPKEFKLQIPQRFLADFVNPKTPYKGILVFHQIGAGKTCAAVNICEKWKNHKKPIVLAPASLTGNFRDELRSQCAGNQYLKKSERKRLKELHPSDKEYKKIIEASNKRIDKYYRIYSYNKFIDLYENDEISLKNSILLIDEIQNMVSECGKFYEVLYEAIHTAPPSLRVVLLSATPMFDKPIEIALTLNLLSLPVEIPIGREFEKTFIKKRVNAKGKYIYTAKNLDIFKERIKGFISYYRGAPPYVYPSSKIRYVRCEMSDFQYRSYLTVKSTEEMHVAGSIRKFRTGAILDLPTSFFLGTRMISNIAFPNKGIGEDGYKSFKKKCLSLERLEQFSTKFYTIINKINKSWGPVFVYSNFKEYGGIRSLTKVLDYIGYKNYCKYGEGKKRYAVWSGDAKSSLREEIKAVFNQRDNYNGSKIKIIIGSPSSKEGISFYNIQQIHILEPYWNFSRMLQIIGRGVRYCSHKNLEEHKRKVKIYIYLSTHPSTEESIDEYIMNLALTKHKLISQFELALKESAVDCTLFKHANVYKKEGEDDIKCDI